MQKGNIGVTSQDIFPLIKKFMYNDLDIFIREIVSNAVDATEKAKTLVSSGEYPDVSDDTFKVYVTINKAERTITVSDHGIGMTEEEIDKYINQIAFSSANEFLEKYKDTNIIGHFGLGFYSAFMVSERVDIITKSYKENATACKWTCTGTTDYEITDTIKTDVGTDVVMHIDSEHDEYLNFSGIQGLLLKYAKYLPVEIHIVEKHEQVTDPSTGEITVPEDTDNKITSDNALWTRNPSELTDDDYINFYKETYPNRPDPLFWIHINIDMPFTFTGILYFPAFDPKKPIFERKHLSLYCNRVFVTDTVDGILPDYLSLLHGVIDSPDIPLNVSRSFLQSDSNVKKISSHITSKVMSSLKNLLKKDRETYETKWDTIKMFIHLGIITDPTVYEKAKDVVLLTDTDNKKYTFDEYYDAVKDNQTNKDGKVVYLYTYETETQYTYLESIKDKGYNVLLFNDQYAAFIVHQFEIEFHDKNVEFKRIDSNTPDKLIEKDEKARKELADNVKNMLISLFNSADRKLKGIDYEFIVNALGDELPITIIADEWFRRMKEMSALNNGGIFLGDNAKIKFILNSDSKIVKKILKLAEKSIGSEIESINTELNDLNTKLDEVKDKPDESAKVKEDIDTVIEKKHTCMKNFVEEDNHVNELIDIALLQYGLLTGEEMSKFIKRSIKMIEK